MTTTGSVADTNLIIATRIYCSPCKKERFQLIDRNGITHSEFKQVKWAQVCDNCKSGTSLEFWPIYKGEKLEETVNSMLRDNWKQQRSSKASSNSDLSNAPGVSDRDYAEFVIRTIKQSVKREDVLVRQVFYTGLSTYTFDPNNLGIIAPTSEGKTYVVTKTLSAFPEKDVWNIGKMSRMVLVRQKGTLVDQDGISIQKEVSELRKKLRLLGNSKKNAVQKQELAEELYTLLEGAKIEIDLSGKILVFLEPPDRELWNLIKPILSHDLIKIEYPFVEKTEIQSQTVKNVVVKGWPACIFCSARDESAWEVWPEIQSRFLITSPNMSKEKTRDANILIGHKKGLPNLVREQVVVSDRDLQLAKQCATYLKHQIKSFYAANNASYESNTNAVWIPYEGILSEALPSNKGSDNRITNRIFSLLNVITLSKGHLRQRLRYGPEKLVIASLADLAEVLHITQNVSGMPTHKMQFFKETFVPLLNSKESLDGEDIRHVTTRQLADYHKEITGKALTTDAIRKNYLEELENNGYVDKQESKKDKRVKIYWPIVELPEIKNCRIESQSRNFLQYSKILLPKNCRKIKQNWLKHEIFALLNYGIQRDQVRLIHENQEVCICQFVKEYEKDTILSLYFSNGENGALYNGVLGKMQLLQEGND